VGFLIFCYIASSLSLFSLLALMNYELLFPRLVALSLSNSKLLCQPPTQSSVVSFGIDPSLFQPGVNRAGMVGRLDFFDCATRHGACYDHAQKGRVCNATLPAWLSQILAM